ncbi:MAG TPA: hypothetical protein VFP19_04315, partial [Candidatus Limnocylindrales bacterium]|nr:hypothetical protein [Candidatus Limnocylindrales bacterium]
MEVLQEGELESVRDEWALPPLARSVAGSDSSADQVGEGPWVDLDEFAKALGWKGWTEAWLEKASAVGTVGAAPTAAAIAPTVGVKPPKGVSYSPGAQSALGGNAPSILFNGKMGHWVRIHGHPIFIEDKGQSVALSAQPGVQNPTQVLNTTMSQPMAGLSSDIAHHLQAQFFPSHVVRQGTTNHYDLSSPYFAPNAQGGQLHVHLNYQGVSAKKPNQGGWLLTLTDEDGTVLSTRRLTPANTPAGVTKAYAQQVALEMMAAHHAEELSQYWQHHQAVMQAHASAMAQYAQQLAAQTQAPQASTPPSPSSAQPSITVASLNAYAQSLKSRVLPNSKGQPGNITVYTAPNGDEVAVKYGGRGYTIQEFKNGQMVGPKHMVSGTGAGYAQMVAAMWLHNRQHGTSIALPTGGQKSGQSAAQAHAHAGIGASLASPAAPAAPPAAGASPAASTQPASPAASPQTTATSLPPNRGQQLTHADLATYPTRSMAPGWGWSTATLSQPHPDLKDPGTGETIKYDPQNHWITLEDGSGNVRASFFTGGIGIDDRMNQLSHWASARAAQAQQAATPSTGSVSRPIQHTNISGPAVTVNDLATHPEFGLAHPPASATPAGWTGRTSSQANAYVFTGPNGEVVIANWASVGGGPGDVTVRAFDGQGNRLASNRYALTPGTIPSFSATTPSEIVETFALASL